MTPRLPTPDQVARLIIAAARACDLDPIEVATARTNTRARAYAFQAVRRLWPALTVPAAARMVGGTGFAAQTTFLRTAPDKLWFEDEVLLRIVRTVNPAFRPSPVRRRSSYVPRAADASGTSLTAALLGDPAPGRSALDRRRAA